MMKFFSSALSLASHKLTYRCFHCRFFLHHSDINHINNKKKILVLLEILLLSSTAATTANCTCISCTSTLKPFQIRSTNVASCFVSHSIISDHDIPFVHFNISEFVLSLLGYCTTRTKIQ